MSNACGDDWGEVWTVLTSMALSLAKLMKKDERTLKEIRERAAIKPSETAMKIGYRKKTWGRTGNSINPMIRPSCYGAHGIFAIANVPCAGAPALARESIMEIMKFYGIIGGIGSGKSTASALFHEYGAAVIDADTIGHQTLLLPEVKNAVRERWGSAVFGDKGEIDRRKLAAVVFVDERELAALTSLTHPLIAEEVRRQQEEHEQSGVQFCLLDAPLLLESGWDHLIDHIIFVEAPSVERWNRVKSRGWSEAEWRQRESAQFSADEKKRRADIILDNTRDVEHLRTQITQLLGGKLLCSSFPQKPKS